MKAADAADKGASRGVKAADAADKVASRGVKAAADAKTAGTVAIAEPRAAGRREVVSKVL